MISHKNIAANVPLTIGTALDATDLVVVVVEVPRRLSPHTCQWPHNIGIACNRIAVCV